METAKDMLKDKKGGLVTVPAGTTVYSTLKKMNERRVGAAVSYTHLTLPTKEDECRSRWSPYH